MSHYQWYSQHNTSVTFHHNECHPLCALIANALFYIPSFSSYTNKSFNRLLLTVQPPVFQDSPSLWLTLSWPHWPSPFQEVPELPLSLRSSPLPVLLRSGLSLLGLRRLLRERHVVLFPTLTDSRLWCWRSREDLLSRRLLLRLKFGSISCNVYRVLKWKKYEKSNASAASLSWSIKSCYIIRFVDLYRAS